jgi:hypothetical protein
MAKKGAPNMTRTTIAMLSVAVMGSLGTISAVAQDGRGVRVGPFRAVPTVGLTVSHESNVLRSSRNEVDSILTVLSPGIQLERGDESRGILFGYAAEIGRYADAETENYNTHRAYMQFRAAPTARVRINGAAAYARGQDVRGQSGAQQGNSIDFNLAPDRFRRLETRVGGEYGAEGARGLLGGNLTYNDLAYRNNRAFTQFRDSSETGIDAMLGWRIAPKTRVTLSAARRDISFDQVRDLRNALLGPTSFDSIETDYQVGLTLDATAKTSGRIGFGRISKDFDDAQLSDFSGSGWDAGITWRPRSYTSIDFAASRRTDESDLVGLATNFESSFLVATDFTVAWSHAWTDRLKSSLDLGFGKSSYRSAVNADNELRDDSFNFYGVGMDYAFRSWLQFGAGFKHYERESSDALFDYDRNVLTVSLEGTLQ